MVPQYWSPEAATQVSAWQTLESPLQMWSAPHVHPASGHAVPQSTVPPQPSPINPQYDPPATLQPARHSVPTHTLFLHCLSAEHAPQRNVCPQTSTRSPQFWVVPVLQTSNGQIPPSVVGGSGRFGIAPPEPDGDVSIAPGPAGASLCAFGTSSTLQAAANERTEIAQTWTRSLTQPQLSLGGRLTDTSLVIVRALLPDGPIV